MKKSILSLGKKITCSLLLLIIVQTSSVAQNFDWSKQIGAADEDVGADVAVDNAGNIYTTGYLQGTVDFDPNTGVMNLSAIGTYDTYIQKLDANGNLVWAKRVGAATKYTIGKAIVVDSFGYIYAVGKFYGSSTDFDPNAGVANLSSSGGSDIFIQKLDTAGNFIWAKSIGGGSDDYVNEICVDKFGNIYLTGMFIGTADFDPSAGVSNLTSMGGQDIFIQKLDSAGNLLWVKGMGTSQFDLGASIGIDSSENVYTTGYFRGTMDVDPGAGVETLVSSGHNDIFIQKLDSAGNFIWGKSIGGISDDKGQSIAVDPTGNSYITGYFVATVDFDPSSVDTATLVSTGGSDIYVLKIDANGNFLWVKQVGSTIGDGGTAITIDDLGNVYTTGYFSMTVDFDPGPDSSFLTCIGKSCFVQKLDANGHFITAVVLTGPAGSSEGSSITLSNSWDIYTTGYFQGTVDFDQGAGTMNLSSVGDEDIFVHKMTQCTASPSTDIISACGPYTWINGITYTTSNNTASCTFISSGGCDSVVTLDLTITTIDTTVTLSGTTLTANATGGSYQWLDCNNSYAIIPSAMSPSFTPSANGNYAVEIAKNGCIDTSLCANVTGVSIINTHTELSTVSVFPNPTTGLINISLDNLTDVSIRVFSTTGQLVYNKENINSTTHQIKLDVMSGVYFIEISTAGKKSHFKIIIKDKK